MDYMRISMLILCSAMFFVLHSYLFTYFISQSLKRKKTNCTLYLNLRPIFFIMINQYLLDVYKNVHTGIKRAFLLI